MWTKFKSHSQNLVYTPVLNLIEIVKVVPEVEVICINVRTDTNYHRWGSSKGEFRKGQVTKTPVGGRVKKADPSSRQGRRTMTSIPLTVLPSAKIWPQVTEVLETKMDW